MDRQTDGQTDKTSFFYLHDMTEDQEVEVIPERKILAKYVQQAPYNFMFMILSLELPCM